MKSNKTLPELSSVDYDLAAFCYVAVFSDGTECMLDSINLGDAEKEAQKLVDSMIARMDNEHDE